MKIRIGLAGVALALGLAGAAAGASSSTSLTLVAYSTPKEAYAKIIPAFQKTAAGRDVEFDQSYGASGDQVRAVLHGLSADVVEFSLQPDMDSLVKGGIVAKNWNATPYHGIVTNSVVVFVVRDGNPKKIHTWGRIVLVNEGRVEQVATPIELYEQPANAFVMGFVGAVNRIGDAWVRPHDVELTLTPNGTTREAQVERLVHLGFEVRVELVRDDGEHLSAQLSRTDAELLELERGQIVYVKPTRVTVFAA